MLHLGYKKALPVFAAATAGSQGKAKRHQGKTKKLSRLQHEGKSKQEKSAKTIQKTKKLRWRSSPKTPRLSALDQLLRIEEDGAYIGLIGLADAEERTDENGTKVSLPESDTDDQRKSSFTRVLVAGVTKWQRKLDVIIASLCSRPLAEVDIEVHQILRIGVFELVQLQTPPHVVNEMVNLAKIASLNPRNAGFVNAILKNLTRKIANKQEIYPEVDANNIDSIAQCHSHPTWMLERWAAQLGLAAAILLMEWNNSPPHYSIRCTSMFEGSLQDLQVILEGLGVEVTRSEYLPGEFLHIASGMQKVKRSSLLTSGCCAVQDESTGLVVNVLDPQPGDHILDGCAAPGGKTLLAASRMNGKGEIIACDVNYGRLEPLKKAIELQEMQHTIKPLHMDLLDIPNSQLKKDFDKVLVDAPCSGSGVLSRRADMRWRRSPEDMENLTVLQDKLLEVASTCVAPGGVLVYSTCSIEKEENEDRVFSFLRSHPEFSIDKSIKLPSNVVSRDGFMQTLPFTHGIDGAFCARLVRKLIQ